MEQSNGEKYFSLAEIAPKYGVSQDYLRFLIFKKKLRGQKIGRNWTTTNEWMNEFFSGRKNFSTHSTPLVHSIQTREIKTFPIKKVFGVWAVSVLVLGIFIQSPSVIYFPFRVAEKQIDYRIAQVNQINFNSENFKEAVLEIPKTIIYYAKKLFGESKTFVQNLIKLKYPDEKIAKKIVVQYTEREERAERDEGVERAPLLTKEGRGEVERSEGLFQNILGRLSLVESRVGLAQISPADLAIINANIKRDTEVLITQAIAGIERRIPPISQNPVVFLTAQAPSPHINEPPQQVSGVSAGFGDFSQGISTGGSLLVSGKVTLGDGIDDVSVSSKTWAITTAGAASGLTSITAESLTLTGGLTLSGGVTLSGGQTFNGDAIFNNNVGIGTSTPGSLLSIDQVGNFSRNATSTLLHGLAVSGINATSSGITISGGTLINTSTATSTFSGGIKVSNVGGLTSGSGLTISGGAILQTGGATSTLLGLSVSSFKLSNSIESTGTATSTFS